MEEEGGGGADRSKGRLTEPGLSGWPAEHAEFGWWVYQVGPDLWQPITSFRHGMIYSQEPLGVPVSTSKALKLMRLGRN